MAFCKYSNECVVSNTTQIDNIFINDFLPNAPDVCVKVYLFGLFKCANPNSFDNSLENFANELNMTPEDVEQAFLYWQDLGVVDIISGTSFEVNYLPIKNAINKTKKFDKSKFGQFNQSAQNLIEGRMITVTEYTEYYNLIEVNHIEPKALLKIIEYCTELKGKNVGYHYILTVARNWINEGITTENGVIDKIRAYGCTSNDIAPILKICGIKRLPNIEEQDKFLKWTKDFGFDTQTINAVAEMIWKKAGKVNFQKLDTKLTTYYEAKRISIEEILDYEDRKAEMFEIAKNVCKAIGVYYENLEPVVENYIVKWQDIGHTAESIELLAGFCFKTSTKTLEGLDNLIHKLYKLGVVSENAIKEYLESVIQQDAEIKDILEKLGVSRNVIPADREFYKVWKMFWNIPNELIDLAIEKSAGKHMAMQYMNKVLSNWHEKGVLTIEEANKNMPQFEPQIKKKINNKQSWEENVTTVNLNALFDSVDDFNVDNV